MPGAIFPEGSFLGCILTRDLSNFKAQTTLHLSELNVLHCSRGARKLLNFLSAVVLSCQFMRLQCVGQGTQWRNYSRENETFSYRKQLQQNIRVQNGLFVFNVVWGGFGGVFAGLDKMLRSVLCLGVLLAEKMYAKGCGGIWVPPEFHDCSGLVLIAPASWSSDSFVKLSGFLDSVAFS